MLARTLALGLVMFAVASVARAQDYAIDPIHTSVLFKVKHLDTAWFYGRFNKPSGLIKTDNGTPTELNVVVDAESVDTGNTSRDDHLRGPDFFDTKQFPEFSFKSTSIKAGEKEGTFDVAGELTMHGTTKPVTLTLTKTGAGKNVQGKPIIGFETSFAIKRSEYGVSGYVDKGIGDDVTLIISVEAIQQ
jgi:polyisoprenoid-binding protein YceI